LPKFRPRNAGGQRGAAIPRRTGKRRDSGVGKPQAPDESKAEHIQAKHVTRGLAGRTGEGTRHKNLIRNLFAWHIPFWGLMNGIWDLGFGYWELGIGIFMNG